MPSVLAWMFGLEYDRALRITQSRSGYWTPTATQDLLTLQGRTGFLGLKPVSDREIEVLWVDPLSPGAIELHMAERGNWSQMSASVLLDLYPAFKVKRHYILRIPYETRDGHLYLQLGRWKAVLSMPKGFTTATKPRPRRKRKQAVKP